ncbi:hypothetical protein [Sphingobacterium sp. 1.A.4]|uniref:hypothetical protein n=1 Tax=Sphingobacterium sp. 1.A.4 TaxID=2044603 RepID=UPI0015D4D71C|nr:hypothetical protein [Sphingobacterium sp. 1.A.4]
MSKTIVSPFEYAIATTVDPNASKDIRPESLKEKKQRIEKEFKSIADKLKVKED